jgi:NitT/TauT family transport system substrate-binding protein
MASAPAEDVRLRLIQPFHSIFYAPHWVAFHLGCFADEGLAVTMRTAGGAVTPTGALLDGTADLALGGVMRSLHLADHGGPVIPHFAEVNSRNGFFLLSRAPRPDFAWSDLVGRTVLSFAEAPTPWQCLLTVLRRNGVDAGGVRIERTLPVSEAVAAFRAGHGDFLETGQPAAEILLTEGAAHLVASMGRATGPVPFSSYMTTGRFLREKRDVLVRFTRALYRAQRWLARAGADEVAEVVAPDFPEIAGPIRLRALARYLAQDTWAHDPLLRRAGYESLQQILLDGGFIERRHPYEDLVDVSIAQGVVEGLREERGGLDRA